MKIISIVFNEFNFTNLKRSMTIGLTTKNKMSFVDETLDKPEVGDESFRT